MTDHQAKVQDLIATKRIIRSSPKGVIHIHWCTAWRQWVFTFEGKIPKSIIRRYLALWIAIAAYFLGERRWFWAWQFLTRLKWRMADGRVPFFKAWNIKQSPIRYAR